MSWQDDKRWSDRYMDEVKQIVGPMLLSAAPFELDVSEATDLVVFAVRDMRIAVRIRRDTYLDRYRDEFTVRAHRDSGSKTELAKLLEGYTDWMFYGFGASSGKLSAWKVICLHSWRSMVRLFPRPEWAPGAKLRDNGDGTQFIAYSVKAYPRPGSILSRQMFGETWRPLVIAESQSIAGAA